jgi:hypothetical protein
MAAVTTTRWPRTFSMAIRRLASRVVARRSRLPRSASAARVDESARIDQIGRKKTNTA